MGGIGIKKKLELYRIKIKGCVWLYVASGAGCSGDLWDLNEEGISF